MKKIGLFLILSLPLCAMTSPTVSNIRASQRENSKLVDILYDVAYSGASNVSITCEVSTNSGISYDVLAESFSGDGFGVMVPTGSDRLIVWNAGVDWDENYSEQVRARITAKAPRFTDHGDGSVTDNQTGLMWQKSPTDYTTWNLANSACATLGEGWRLPTAAEVRELLDTSRTPHLPVGHPFGFSMVGIHWTTDFRYVYSSTYDRYTPVVECFSLTAEEVIFTAPTTWFLGTSLQYYYNYVWPVRSVY